ncbi:MAG: sigma-54 interaction domain-containing protein, partial [Desulfovibrionales bacterium]
PCKPDEVILTIKKAEERLQLATENEFLRQELSGKKNGKKIVYRSKAMEHILELVEKVAASSSTVLVTGETGTGKELVARALHAGGGRNKGPFVPLNCGAISPGLMESELFGHVRGAFTGADRDKQGLFAAADKGTLFLDEIGELPMELQPKLLRALQDGEIMQVGGTKTRKADVRVLAATARDLKEELEKGRFRDDFYYRLAVVEIHIPPLRERKEDIQVLAEHFIKKIAAREQRPVPTLAEDALDVLHSYHWPGNVRELENLMEKTMIFCREETIDSSSLPWETRRKRRVGEESYSLKQATKRIEKEFIHKALAATEGNRTQAAGLLEISLRSLLYKLKEYNIS